MPPWSRNCRSSLALACESPAQSIPLSIYLASDVRAELIVMAYAIVYADLLAFWTSKETSKASQRDSLPFNSLQRLESEKRDLFTQPPCLVQVRHGQSMDSILWNTRANARPETWSIENKNFQCMKNALGKLWRICDSIVEGLWDHLELHCLHSWLSDFHMPIRNMLETSLLFDVAKLQIEFCETCKNTRVVRVELIGVQPEAQTKAPFQCTRKDPLGKLTKPGQKRVERNPKESKGHYSSEWI